MSLVKGRTCSESCMELLSLELVHYYARQSNIPAPAAIEAIGTINLLCVYCFVQYNSYVFGQQELEIGDKYQFSCVAAGFRVGRQLAERYTANRARLGEPLEVIKFICKEFWAAAFRKQVWGLIRPKWGSLFHFQCAWHMQASVHLHSHSKVHERQSAACRWTT